MKRFWVILIVGIGLRLFLSLSTLHPDLGALSLGGKFVSDGHILNLYEFSTDALVLNYPPLIYWFFGLLNLLFGNSLYLMKLSYLIFDLTLGLILTKLVNSQNKILTFSLWMFNPISLYATYMMGQFDIIPTFFSVLSIYLALKNKLTWAALVLGVGIAFKLYPVFLIIPLILLGKGLWTKAKLVVYTLLPYIASVLPYISSSNFRSNALFANQSSKSLYASIPVSGGESILLFPTFIVLFYFLILRQRVDKVSLWKLYLAPLLLFFIFTHFHPQWLIWVTPFLILDLVFDRLKNVLPILIIFISWILSLFFFDASLTTKMFAPLFPFLKLTPDIWTLLKFSVDYNFARSLLQSIFAGAAIYIIYKRLK
ncbi:MAG: hypothetical protein AAB414_02680 [Patescibacteria group bacterium]